jgi:excinuclease UvrABC ATPase subunit
MSRSKAEPVPNIARKFQTLHDAGLDYIRLGQPATTPQAARRSA